MLWMRGVACASLEERTGVLVRTAAEDCVHPAFMLAASCLLVGAGRWGCGGGVLLWCCRTGAAGGTPQRTAGCARGPGPTAAGLSHAPSLYSTHCPCPCPAPALPHLSAPSPVLASHLAHLPQCVPPSPPSSRTDRAAGYHAAQGLQGRTCGGRQRVVRPHGGAAKGGAAG